MPPRDTAAFEFFARFVAAAAPFAMHGLLSGSSLTVDGIDLLRRARAGEGFIGALWHEDLPLWAYVFRGTGFTVLASRSRDGEIAARVARRFGLRSVRGSSSRGGEEALRETVDILRGGGSVGFIADGPRGPRHVSKIGPILAAKMSGRAIVPIGCAMLGALRLRNWDRTRVPLPFARIVVCGGEPMRVPPDASRDETERLRQRLQDAMIAMEERATRYL